MNTNDPMPAIDEAPELWFEMLAAGELAASQKRALCDFLESHPEYWRDCGIAMMDVATLRGLGRSEQAPSAAKEANWKARSADATESLLIPMNGHGPVTPKSQPGTTASKPSLRAGRRRWLLAATLASALSALAFLGGRSASLAELDQLRGALRQSEAEKTELVDVVLALEVPNVPLSLSQLYQEHPMLIELVNTESYALYLTDRPVSEGMLVSFFEAGYTVDVRPYSPKVETQLLSAVAAPVLAVEVRKTDSQLIAQGD